MSDPIKEAYKSIEEEKGKPKTEEEKEKLKAYLIENIDDLADGLIEIGDVQKYLKEELRTVEMALKIAMKRRKGV